MSVTLRRASIARWFALWCGLLGGVCTLSGVEMPKVIFVPIDEATADFFDDPPSPLDYAAFLKSVRRHEPQCVGVVDLLHWPQVAPAILNGLISQAKPLNVAYAAMLDNDATDPDIVNSLSAFPQDFLAKGDLEALASFKSVPRLPDKGLLEDKVAGFTVIDFGEDVRVTPSGIEVPLIARGPDSELALSLPLLIAGQALGVSWNEVSIDIGKALLLGEGSQAIALNERGQVMVPLEPSASLQRLAGDQFIATETPVESAQGAVLVIGSDLESDRLFALSDGRRVSRAELVSQTVCYLLEQATREAPAPEPDPVLEVAEKPQEEPPDVVTSELPGPPIRHQEIYHFPDLRAPNIGLWILGISGGLAFGCLLLSAKPKRGPSDPPPESAEAKPERAVAPSQGVSLTKKRESTSEGSVPEEKVKAIPAPDKEDHATAQKEANSERAGASKKGQKRPGKKKRTRSQRRRSS